MATAGDLIQASLEHLGVLETGESASTAQDTFCLAALNRLIDSLSNSPLLIHHRVQESFSITGASPYTIGSGGDFNTTRPIQILKAFYRSGGVDYPMRIVGQGEFSDITVKDLSSRPTHLYYEKDYALGKIHIWQDGTGTLFIDTIKPLSTLATTGTTVTLPEGYEDMLVWNLAKNVSSHFWGRIDPHIVMMARETMAALKRANTTQEPAKFDTPSQSDYYQFESLYP